MLNEQNELVRSVNGESLKSLAMHSLEIFPAVVLEISVPSTFLEPYVERDKGKIAIDV